ncbi:hypothetical protein ATI61_106448 [Archangium gephyra]|uniref:Uncharacterized protein n=1 Tax=Archangium gephyra TaxID=48 RepID=A0AAC8Q175_9BACT|nr:hypothetical protein [Archangium gephyra]AKI99072.1 Hypothetical protein AA314_00699 [Archangium gephyra]REG30978.1 hypothetical protein ATI61_106448 [Archangium gephyra]
MKIHVWNAFASNNSGSYTIVGRFPSEELATRVAAELSAVLEAHERWRGSPESRQEDPEKPSPLRAFTQAHSLTQSEADQADQGELRAWSTGHQVFLHDPWTLTLQDSYEEFLRVRGGKVETRIRHAHGDLVSVFELHGTLPKKTKAATVSAVVEEWYADDGPLVTLAPFDVQPAWREGSKPGEPVLTLGAVFQDLELAPGYTAVETIARRHGLQVTVRVSEDQSPGDPLAWLRPSHPALARKLFDVWILDAGHSLKEVARRLVELRRGRYIDGPTVLKWLPDAVLKRLTRDRAEQAVQFLRKGGANAELRPAE